MEDSNFSAERQGLLAEIISLEQRLASEGYSSWLKSQIEGLEERLHIVELAMYTSVMAPKVAPIDLSSQGSIQPDMPIANSDEPDVILKADVYEQTQKPIVTFGAFGQRSLDLS